MIVVTKSQNLSSLRRPIGTDGDRSMIFGKTWFQIPRQDRYNFTHWDISQQQTWNVTLNPTALPATLGEHSLDLPIVAMFPLELQCTPLWLGNGMEGSALGKPPCEVQRGGGLPQRALSALFTGWFIEARWLLLSHTKRKVVEAVLWWKGILGLGWAVLRRASNTWNMNIHCYFIIGKPKHQEEVELDVTTTWPVFVKEKSWKRQPPFFLQYLSKQIVGYRKHCINRKLRTLSH